MLGLALGCLPPATIETTTEPALVPASTTGSTGDECRALISERSDRGPLTHELRWDNQGVRSTQTHAGMVVGTPDELFAIWASHEPFDGLDLYGASEPDLRCEEEVIWVRRMPHGVPQRFAETMPTCVGTAHGKPIAVESHLSLVSAFGPLIGWRTQVDGHDPDPITYLSYETTDLRTFSRAIPQEWVLEQLASMQKPSVERVGCEEADAPRVMADTRGFALRWDGRGPPRVRVGYGCCRSAPYVFRSCELDDPLPRIDPELTAMLPDADALLHSPFGCGSIGLDGSVRTRDGALVGQTDVDPSKLLGVVFLPSDHAFEPGWLRGDVTP
jgi:hypothetical protein